MHGGVEAIVYAHKLTNRSTNKPEKTIANGKPSVVKYKHTQIERMQIRA